jgi:tetratricopeptide (TPR) repeat protein
VAPRINRLAALLLFATLLPAHADNRLECLSRDVDRGIRYCSFIIEQHAGHASVAAAYASRGIAYWQKGAYQKAAADSNQAIRLGSNFALAYLMRGIHLDDTGDHHAALADFTRAIEIQPSPTAYYNRGTAYFALADYARAITDFDQALASEARLPQAYINRALAHLALGHSEVALADIQRGAKLLPQNPPAGAILKRVLAAVGQTADPFPQSTPLHIVTDAPRGSLAFFPVSKVLPTQAPFVPPVAPVPLTLALTEPPRARPSTLQPPPATHLPIAERSIGRTPGPRKRRFEAPHRPLRVARVQGMREGQDGSVAHANRDRNELLERFRFSSER